MIALRLFRQAMPVSSPPSFFSNSALISFKHEFSRQAYRSTRGPFFSNVQKMPTVDILQSSMNPFKHARNKQIMNFRRTWSTTIVRYARSPFSGGKSDTWKRYNKHYGNSNWNRLKGPALFTAGFFVGTYFLIPVLFDYTPLSVLKRNPQILLYTIIAANGIVYMMWNSGRFSHLLSRYGLLVKDNVYSNWSLLGSAFSHQSLGHIMVNMFVLQSFGSSLCAIMGAPGFLMFYLNSAVFSSFMSLVIPTLMRSSMVVGSLGASGAVFSVVAAFSYLVPKAPVAFFFIPIPGGAWFVFLATVAYNATGLFFRWGAYDYAAHLGGSLAGVITGWYIKNQAEERRRARYIRTR